MLCSKQNLKISHIVFHVRLELPRKYVIRPSWWKTSRFKTIGVDIVNVVYKDLSHPVLRAVDYFSRWCRSSGLFSCLLTKFIVIIVNKPYCICPTLLHFSYYNFYIDRSTCMYCDTILLMQLLYNNCFVLHIFIKALFFHIYGFVQCTIYDPTQRWLYFPIYMLYETANYATMSKFSIGFFIVFWCL